MGHTKVKIDPRIELLTTVFRLSGAWEFKMDGSESEYSKRVDAYFAKYKDHPAVKFASKLREEDGIGFDGVTGFAVYLSDTVAMKELVPFTPEPPHWDKRWKPQTAREFVASLKSFVKDTRFNAFMAKERPYFERATGGLVEVMKRHDVDTWCRQFFGKSPSREPFAIVGLLCGGGNYGVSVEYPDGSIQMTPVFGASPFDKNDIPAFDDTSVPTVVHEFSHAYANPATAKYFKTLVPAAEKFMPKLANVFAANAYGRSETILCESFTRMSEVYQTQKHLPQLLPRVLESQRGTGFLWISELLDWADEYENNREKYKTIDDFMPILAERFIKLSENPEVIYARCPRMTSFQSHWGNVDGDDQEVTLSVTFDRVMQKDKRGLTLSPQGAVVTKATEYEPDGKSLKLTFKVKRDTEYTVGLNAVGRGYTSESGYPLLPTFEKIKSPSGS